jgi:2-dehydropantoate 2-reductase
MKIAIMGTGGVGGYYGGLLAQAGHEVIFIARGVHLAAICNQGLQVKSVFGDFRISPAQATDKPSEVGSVELVVFATKTYHTDDAAQLIKPMVGRDTVVISFQNGVDAAESIGGATWLSAAIESPGVIGQYSQFRRIVLGEFDGSVTPRAQALREVFQSTGAAVELVQNIEQILWTKFVFISAISALGSLTRVTMGEYRGVREARTVLTEALHEVVAVAQAKGVPLNPDVVTNTLKFIDESAATIKPSMQRDIEAGRMSELESMIGIVVRLGTKISVPTPVMGLAYAVLKPGELKARN